MPPVDKAVLGSKWDVPQWLSLLPFEIIAKSKHSWAKVSQRKSFLS
jgi:hypothetical protein